MEYANNKKHVLSLMDRIDFKNLSEIDTLSYASKLDELRPEVAQQILAQSSELAELIQVTMVRYQGILKKTVASDDENIKQVCAVLNKEIDATSENGRELIEHADRIRADLSKCLDNPNLTPEQQKGVVDHQMEIFHAVDKKDTEIREQEMKSACIVDKKDTEKKEFSWEVTSAASFVLMTAVGIDTMALGSKFNIKLLEKQ